MPSSAFATSSLALCSYRAAHTPVKHTASVRLPSTRSCDNRPQINSNPTFQPLRTLATNAKVLSSLDITYVWMHKRNAARPLLAKYTRERTRPTAIIHGFHCHRLVRSHESSSAHNIVQSRPARKEDLESLAYCLFLRVAASGYSKTPRRLRATEPSQQFDLEVPCALRAQAISKSNTNPPGKYTRAHTPHVLLTPLSFFFIASSLTFPSMFAKHHKASSDSWYNPTSDKLPRRKTPA